MEDNDHELAPLLAERLANVGLDGPTYGPYVLPLISTSTYDAEEWDSVFELLRASSETYNDNEEVWVKLRDDIIKAWNEHCASEMEREAKNKQENEKALHDEIERERQEARELLELTAIQAEEKTKASNVDDDARRALVARYAFEAEDEDEGTEEVETNQQVAANAAQEKQQEMRKQHVTTKKEEQQKTSQAKKDKAALKEERRKRATKGERRR